MPALRNVECKEYSNRHRERKDALAILLDKYRDIPKGEQMGRNKKCSYRRTNFRKEMRKSTILKEVAQVQKVFNLSFSL